VAGFLYFGVPNVFHMVSTTHSITFLNCYLLCAPFIPQVPNVFPIALHFKPISFAQGSIVTYVGSPEGKTTIYLTLGELTVGEIFVVVG
jgi:hypothetical protein